MSSRYRFIFLALFTALAVAACSDQGERLSFPAGDPPDGKIFLEVAGDSVVAGPYHFERAGVGRSGPMRPLYQRVEFAVDQAVWGTEFVLRLATGHDRFPSLSSASVRLNGEEILGPDAFDGEPQQIDVPVDLAAMNVLEVKIAGQPGSACDIALLGAAVVDLQARVLYPLLDASRVRFVPPTLRAGFEGRVGEDEAPASYRTLLVPAEWEGEPLTNPALYAEYAPLIFARDDLPWTSWEPYPAFAEDRRVEFADLENLGYYLFAVQVRDAEGRVSDDFAYQRDVIHVRALADFFRPTVHMSEPELGEWTNTQLFTQVAAGQMLAFSWEGDASPYNGNIVSYRHGWDLVDPEDPNDPGWAVAPGLGPENLAADPRSFSEGTHVLYVRVESDIAGVTLMRVTLYVVTDP